MRSFVGDEAFEPVIAPPPPAPAGPEAPYDYVPPRALVTAVVAVGIAGEVYEVGKGVEKAESGDPSGLIRTLWRLLPDRFRRPVLRVALALLGGFLALVAIPFGMTRQPAPAAILLAAAALMFVYAAAPGWLLGLLDRLKRAVAGLRDRADKNLEAGAGAANAYLERSASRSAWRNPMALVGRFWVWFGDVPPGAYALSVLSILTTAGAVGSLVERDWTNAAEVGVAALGFVTALIVFYIAPGAPRRFLMSRWDRLVAAIDIERTWPIAVGVVFVVAGTALGLRGGLKNLFGAAVFVGAGGLTVALVLYERLGRRKRPPAEAPADERDAHAPAAALAPPLRLDVYLQRDLPPLPFAYAAPVGAERNVIGLPPQRLFYLCDTAVRPEFGRTRYNDLRRFGPASFLGPPSGVKSGAGAFEAANGAPLPPGDRDLTSVSHLSGGYPQRYFRCGKADWRGAAASLIDQADKVFVAVSGDVAATPDMAWALRQLIDRTSTERFIVLVDEKADQTALCATIRSAWSRMAANSPNNRPDAGPVRWVILDPVDSSGVPVSTPRLASAEIDPGGLRAGKNPVSQYLFDIAWGAAVSEDRIMGLLIDAGGPVA